MIIEIEGKIQKNVTNICERTDSDVMETFLKKYC